MQMSDLAIDRAIAAVRQEIEDWEGFAEEHGGHALEQLHALRAALAILEAARAWSNAKDRLSGEHPRTLATNRALTEAQLSLERTIRGGQ